MRCDTVRENLVAFLDGELDAEERERIDSHLANCPACRTEKQGLSSTGDLLSILDREKSTLDLAGRVLKTVTEGDPWCRHIQRELTAWLDKELEETEARPVREHLAECEECVAFERNLARTAGMLPIWKTPEFDVDLLPRVLAEVKPKRGRIFRILGAAAACLLLAAGAALLISDDGPKPEVLENLDFLVAESSGALSDPQLLDVAEELDWLDSISEEELCLLNGNGHGK